MANLNFPIEVFPTHYQDYIRNLSLDLDSPVEFISCSILAGASICMSNGTSVRIKQGWVEPSILWTMILGNPGIQSKSPCFNTVKSAVDSIAIGLQTDYQFHLNLYNDKLKLHKDSKSKDSIASGMPIIPHPGDKPTVELIYTSETTIEGLKKFQSLNEKGLAVMNDEISSFFRSLNQYKSGGNDEQYMQSAFSASRVVYTRAGLDESVSLIPYHNVFGTTQPSEVSSLLFKDLGCGNGTVDRWLFCQSNYKRTGNLMSSSMDRTLLKNDFKTLYDIPVGTEYHLSEEAYRLFSMEYKLNSGVMANSKTPKLLIGYLTKQSIYIARFALILHCLSNSKDLKIPARCVADAILISKYYVECFKNIANLTIDSQNNTDEEYVLEWMKTKALSCVTLSTLAKSNKKRFKRPEDARDVLSNLETMGYGYLNQQGKGVLFTLTSETVVAINLDNTNIISEKLSSMTDYLDENILDRRLTFSLGKKQTGSVPDYHAHSYVKTKATYRELIAYTYTHNYSPSTFVDNYRKSANTEDGLSFLAFDIDKGMSLQEARIILSSISSIIIPTKSHQVLKGNEPACDRFRVIIPLNNSDGMPIDRFKEVLRYVGSLFNLTLDAKCIDSARLYSPSMRATVDDYWISDSSRILSATLVESFGIGKGCRVANKASQISAGSTYDSRFRPATLLEYSDIVEERLDEYLTRYVFDNYIDGNRHGCIGFLGLRLAEEGYSEEAIANLIEDYLEGQSKIDSEDIIRTARACFEKRGVKND